MDALLGLGDINRGLGKRPRNVPRMKEDDHVLSDSTSGRSDHSSPQPDVIMEDESNTTVMRRQRQIRSTKAPF
ncbi:hypothetical protein A0H81_08162 [Grifola frondosa]|uniref:Uncharacterized protein n=1 Tax=Grifola frondosa TaxID=5627 RepID=A0A1C7M551_GRIFR|nr:hypothetical protein A0H81_08162 [Grifola frondosa]